MGHVSAHRLHKMAASSGWNEEKEEQLAQMWEEREFLYNHNVKGYNNRAKKDQAIREIAYAVEVPIGNVMKRMTSLRTQYSRAKNKSKTDLKPPSRKTRWLFDHLGFLAPFVESKSANHTDGGEPDNTPMEDDLEFETVMPKRVQFKKKEYKRRHIDMDSDDDNEEYMAHTATMAALQAVRDTSPVHKGKSTTPVKKDQEQLFCDFIAGELRQMTDPVAKARLMNKIQTEVFASRIGETYQPDDTDNGEEGYGEGPVQCKMDPSEHCALNNNDPGGLGSPGPAPQQSNLMGINESDSYKLSPTSGLTSY